MRRRKQTGLLRLLGISVVWMMILFGVITGKSVMAYATEGAGTEATQYRLMLFCDLEDVVEVEREWYAPGETVTLRANVPAGYTTPDWIYPGEDGEAAFATADQISFVMPEGNAVVFCYPQPIPYTITYELDGGVTEWENPDTYNVTWSDFTLINPTKEGYAFLGWTGSNGDAIQHHVVITRGTTGDLHFTAHWMELTEESTTYTVNYWTQNLDGDAAAQDPTNYSLAGTEEFSADAGMAVSPTPWMLEGFAWPEAQTVTVAADGGTLVEYYYTRNSYRVTVVTEGQAECTGEGIYLYEDTVSLYFTYAPGYMNGVFLMIPDLKHSGTLSSLKFTMPAYDVTVYVYPSRIMYDITYTDAAGVENPTRYHVETETFTLENPVREGYDFLGWTGSNGDTPQKTVTIEQGSTGERTYIANWQLCAASYFTDLDLTQWYHESVDYVVAEGLMQGIGEDRFAPMDTLDRCSMVTILYTLSRERQTASLKEKEQWIREVRRFTDVEAGSWYEEAVAWAAARGITNGTSDTTFAPEGDIDRQQYVVMLFNYYKNYLQGVIEPGAELSGFVDGETVDSWAVEGVSWAVGHGILSGKPQTDGTVRLDPHGAASRVEAAALLHRFAIGFVTRDFPSLGR